MTNLPTETENAPAWAADLNLRERRFVEEYVIDLNGRQAAKRASLGKSVESATQIASRMRKKPHVAAAISALMAERSGVTGAAVVNELGAIAFSKITDYLKVENGRLILAVSDLNELPDEQKAAIAKLRERVNDDGSISIEVELHDKLVALDKLGKSIGLFKERAEVAHRHEVEVVDPLERIQERLNALAKAQRAERLAEIEPPPRRIAPPQPPKSALIIEAE